MFSAKLCLIALIFKFAEVSDGLHFPFFRLSLHSHLPGLFSQGGGLLGRLNNLSPSSNEKEFCQRCLANNPRTPQCTKCRDIFLTLDEVLVCGKVILWRPGDGCGTVGKRFGMTPADLEALNLELECSGNSNGYIGQPICVEPASNGKVSNFYNCTQFHVALEGENCLDLTSRYPFPIDFVKLNPQVNCSGLVLGEILCVKPSVKDEVPPLYCSFFHAILEKTESCQSVAATHHLNVADLIKFNPGIDCDKPFAIGQILCAKPFKLDE